MDFNPDSPVEILKGTLKVARRSGPAAAVRSLRSRLATQKEEQKRLHTCEELRETRTGRSVFAKLESNEFTQHPSCSTFLLQTIARLIGVPEKMIPDPEGWEEPRKGSKERTRKEEGPELTITLGPRHYAKTKKGFEALLGTLSAESREVLAGSKDQRSWFEIHVEQQKG
jgi:cytochrome P450